MVKKKISVVIATYNGEKYIIEELKSILAQTILPDELIISDDCSRDKTCEVVEKFITDNQLDNWKVHRNENNKGFSKNFLDAMYMSTGDLVFLADQDDLWVPDKIETMLKMFEIDANTKSVASEFTFIDGEGNQIEPPTSIPNTKCVLDGKYRIVDANENIISSYIRGCTTCVTRDVIDYIEKNQLQEMCSNKLLGHDWFLWMFASLMGNCYILHKPLIKYRVHDSNSSLEALQRKTLIGNTEARIEGLRKSISVHKYIKNHKKDFINYSEEIHSNIVTSIRFEEKRLKYLEDKGIFLYLSLLCHLKKYERYYRNFLKGIKVYVGDFMYAHKRGANR